LPRIGPISSVWPNNCTRSPALTRPAACSAGSSRHRTWPAATRIPIGRLAPLQPRPRPNVRHGLGRCWLRAIYEELEIFPLGQRKRNSKTGPLPLNPGPEDQVDGVAPLIAVYPNNCRELISSSRVQFDRHDSMSSSALFHFRHTDINTRQSSRLAEFGGLGMSFNVYRGTLGSLAMFTAIRKASSRDSRPNRPPPRPLSGA